MFFVSWFRVRQLADRLSYFANWRILQRFESALDFKRESEKILFFIFFISIVRFGTGIIATFNRFSLYYFDEKVFNRYRCTAGNRLYCPKKARWYAQQSFEPFAQ